MILQVGMAWTQADADAVRAAILQLAAGTRVVTIKYGGPPPREITYQQADLKVLKELLAEMESVAAAATTGSYRLVSTRKGLG